MHLFKWRCRPNPTSSIEVLRRDLAYLGLEKIDISEAQERQRYLSNYEGYRFLASLAVTSVVFLVGSIAILVIFPDLLCRNFGSAIWPMNAQLLANIDQQQITPDMIESICPIISLSSWSVICWSAWLAHCLYSELVRRDHYGERVVWPVLLFAALVVYSWFVSGEPLGTHFDTTTANLQESAYIGAIKKATIISFTMIGTGYCLFYLSTALLHRGTR